MRILILNPSSRVTRNVVRDVLYGCWCKGKRIGGGTVPPFTLLLLATVLKEDGNDVTFLDAQAEQKNFSDLLKIIRKYNIVIISISTMSFLEDSKMLSDFKKVNPDLKTIIFGSHPTFLPKSALSREGVDIIVRREPEFIIRDLIRKLRKFDKNWRKVKGIGYKEKKNMYINNFYPLIEDLDKLPFLNTSMLSKEVNYFNPLIKNMPYITTSTSRGCPGKCTFCTAPNFYGKRIRFRSATSVIEEINTYLKQGYKEVYFRDDTFVVNKNRNRDICEGLIKRDLKISWLCNARVGMINKKDMELMKKAGCHYLKFGVESGVQGILNKSKKGIKIEQTIKTFQWCKELGIDTHAHVMLGMPGDTEDTIKQTISFILKIKPTTATFGICTPYPGAPLFEEVFKKYPKIKDGTSSDFSVLHTKGIFNELYTDLNKQKLEEFLIKAYRKFYFRPSYWFNIFKKIRDKKDIKKYSIAATNILSFSIKGEG